jgi:tetratricopeptide (TPR) repeat protein
MIKKFVHTMLPWRGMDYNYMRKIIFCLLLSLGMIACANSNKYLDEQYTDSINQCYKLTEAKDYDKAEQKCSEAISVAKQINSADRTAIAETSLADVYLYEERIDEAIKIFERAKNTCLNAKCSDHRILSLYDRIFHHYCFRMRNPDEAMKVVEEILSKRGKDSPDIILESHLKEYADLFDKVGFNTEAKKVRSMINSN